MPKRPERSERPNRRALRSFWLLLGLSILAVATLSTALTATPGALTGLVVAVSGLVLIASLALATRIMLALERVRRRTHQS